MSYFTDNRGRVNPQARIEGQPGLRAAQAGAVWALGAHFSLAKDPAIVAMPTGSGKTAVMSIIPFTLATNRVLVVTPSVLVRDQVVREFEQLKVAKDVGVAEAGLDPPKVARVTKRLADQQAWETLRDFDVAVGTPHCLSPGIQGIATPAEDLFDLVIVDEAHHAAARTWVTLLNSFPKAPRVLFTATPFRHDARRIPGTTVYDYPLSKAIEERIYQAISFEPVTVAAGGDRDAALAERAIELVRSALHHEAGSKLLIRTDRVSKADELAEKYASLGCKVGVVNSHKTLRTNNHIINQLRAGELDGVISVGVLGEGFDLPELKIAVYHERHKSLPATLQFVGRVARTHPERFATAHLVAIREDVNDETRELYAEDAHWATLIPELNQAAIDNERRVRAYVNQFEIPEGLDISPHLLRPSPQAKLLYGDVTSIDLAAASGELGHPYTTIYSNTDDDGQLLAIITAHSLSPPWIAAGTLEAIEYDLHLVYKPDGKGLLFLYSPTYASERMILAMLGKPPLRLASPTMLNRILARFEISGYSSVGMRNSRMPGRFQPTYKTIAGSEVNTSITPSDGRAFAPGHLIGRYREANGLTGTIGVAMASAKVWSLGGGSLLAFKDWCDDIATAVEAAGVHTVVPLTPLRLPEELEDFPEHPLGAILNRKLLANGACIKVGDAQVELASMPIELVREGDESCLLSFIGPQDEVAALVRVAVGGSPTAADPGHTVYWANNQFPEIPLHDLLDQYPPVLFFRAASTMGQQVFRQVGGTARVAQSTLTKLDWSQSNILDEATQSDDQPRSVQYTVIHELLRRDPKAIVILDDGKGEIADVIHLQFFSESCHITLYHCKKSSSAQPGVRETDVEELCPQGIKSVRWVQTDPTLIFKELARRIRERPPTKVVSNQKEDEILGRLDELAADAPEVSFTVALVQPGLLIDRVHENAEVNALLLNSFEWISEQGLDFSVVGA